MQEIITYTIIIVTGVYAGWQIYRTLKPVKKDEPGCGSGCGCDAVELKKELLSRKLKGS